MGCLARAVSARVWPDWERTAFPVLLVTAELEFLVGATHASDDFTSVGPSSSFGGQVFSRPRQFDLSLTAAFPALGSEPIVVIGQAQAIKKSSKAWVLTALHEHFHQFQMSHPGYYSAIAGLGLAGDDDTGMWMLNYPFPYESPEFGERFAALGQTLALADTESSPAARRAALLAYEAFLDGLSEHDRRYVGFQVWQEGVARFVELRSAELAASEEDASHGPSLLPGPESYAELAHATRERVLVELGNADLASGTRSSFYALGAGLALVLDHEHPDWKSRYLREMFQLEQCAR